MARAYMRGYRAAHRDEINARASDYMRARYAERMSDARAVLGGTCVECGGADDPCFHHSDPTTKVKAVAALTCYARAIFDAEVAKCVLLCGSCHTRFHRLNPDPTT